MNCRRWRFLGFPHFLSFASQLFVVRLLFSLSTTIRVQGDVNGESTTLRTAGEQISFGGLWFWLLFFFSYSGLQCVLFSPCCTFSWSLCCSHIVTRGECSWQFRAWDTIQTPWQVAQKIPNLCYSYKNSEPQRKWVGKKNFNPLFPRRTSTAIGCSSVALPLQFQIESVSAGTWYFMKHDRTHFPNPAV